MPKKDFSREYLEEALTEARKLLPGWAWAMIHQAARPKAGARARHQREPDTPTPLEKIALAEIRPATLSKLPDDELRQAWLRLNQWFASFKHRNQPVEDVVNAALWTIDEMERRDFEVKDNALTEAVAQLRSTRKDGDILAKLGGIPHDLVVVKDFVSIVGSAAKGKDNPVDIDVLVRAPWDREACQMHIQADNVWLPVRNALDPDKTDKLHWIDNPQGPHGDNIPVYDLVLRRKAKLKTEVMKAEKDGAHSHKVLRDDLKADGQGTHSHAFELADGSTVQSKKDGDHTHALRTSDAETTTVGGAHDHEVVLADGTTARTARDGAHSHSIVNGKTAVDGAHTHVLELAGKSNESSPAVKADLVKLDIGCGTSKAPGYIGLDKSSHDGVDHVLDLEGGIPWADGSVDVVRANHVLEHLADKERIMSEIHRVLRPGGRFTFEVPSTKSEGAFAHPDHKSFWNKSSFAFWTQDGLLEDRPRFDVKELEEIERGDLVYVTGVLVKPVEVEKSGFVPFETFTPPKPTVAGFTELFDIDTIWKWAKDRTPIAVEPKHNGFRCIAEKKGDRLQLWFEGQPGKDQLGKMPEIKKALAKVSGDYVLDCDVGIERDGKRVARPVLATLNAAKPVLEPDDEIVLTLFDVPYRDRDLTKEPLESRRESLERMHRSDFAPAAPVLLSPLRWIRTKPELQRAARWAFGQDRSEGLMAKSASSSYELDGTTNEWSKLKRVAELKVIVLRSQRTKAGAWNYSGGLIPSDDKFETEDFRGKKFVNLGKSFSTSVVARPGDILTVQVLELIPDEEKRNLAWLGARVQDVDKSRTTPFTVGQSIDIAKRAKVLQKSTDIVSTVGPKNAAVAFVGASPGRVEAARHQPFTGPTGETLSKLYLEPLGMSRSEVILTNAVPVLLTDEAGRVRQPNTDEIEEWRDWLTGELDRLSPQLVVALGRAASEALGDRADFTLPHPSAVRRFGDFGPTRELKRKIRQIQTALKDGVVKQRLGEEGGGETRGEVAFRIWEDTWHKQLPKSGKGRYVYHHHWRGLDDDEAKLSDSELMKTNRSLHGDLRLEGDDALWGWAVLLGKTEDNRDLPSQDKLVAMNEGKLKQAKLQLANKLTQPKEWLNVGVRKPLVTGPGEIGATSKKSAKFFALDTGTYELGVVRKHGVEIFLDGKKLKGRYLLQFAPVAGRRIWLIDKPEDQEPMAERRNLDDLIKEIRQKKQKFLIWSKPGERPQKFDVMTGKVVKTSAVSIIKADDEKQIVYGVVLDPYQFDSQGDWTPPADVEKTAHEWFKKSRLISLNHAGPSQSVAVESWVEQYPSRSDYRKAVSGEPHRAYRRKFGTDIVHSGAWIVGTQLVDSDWAAYKRGELDAYSIEGYGSRIPVSASAMPAVTFVDLKSVPGRWQDETS